MLEAVKFPTPVPTVNWILAVEPAAIEMLLDPDVAENVRDLAVSPVLELVNRVLRSVFAFAS